MVICGIQNLDNLCSTLLLAFRKFQTKDVKLGMAGFLNKCPTQRKAFFNIHWSHTQTHNTHTHAYIKRY